jgi:hypothetical protein
MRNLLVKLLVLVMVTLTISETALADTRIRFARGRTSATVSGRVGTGGRVCYVARANAGQTLNAAISSRSGQVRIFESGETSYSLNVEYSGDQSICVDNYRGATTYTLTVSIR